MLSVELADGRRVAIRPSGTEPKIKFYMFARRDPAAGAKFTPEELGNIKAEVGASLNSLWNWIQKDVNERLA
jgi:phosphoglucomutase